MSEHIEKGHLLADIREVLLSARTTAYKAVNLAMVSAYWNVGRLIVEDEQHGNRRAEYGKAVLSELSDKLTAEFGKGFEERELRRMRQFYCVFPKWGTLRPELTWSHYRLLIKVKDNNARLWYMNEAVVKYPVLAEYKQIFASKYLLELPSVETLQKELIRERERITESEETNKKITFPKDSYLC